MAEVYNPITGAFEALWGALETHADFAQEVPPGNRLKYPMFYEPPIEDALTQSTTPRVAVVLTTFELSPRATSSGTLSRVQFEVVVSTSAQRAESVLDVFWAVVRALVAWHSSLGDSTWKEKGYMYCARPLATKHSLVAAKGVKGWACAMVVEVAMSFRTADLTA